VAPLREAAEAVRGAEPTARARSLLELGRWSAAAAFAEVVRARPDVASLWIERGRYYVTRARPEKAAADFARAIDVLPADNKGRSRKTKLGTAP
jgi:hypothetical protein